MLHKFVWSKIWLSVFKRCSVMCRILKNLLCLCILSITLARFCVQCIVWSHIFHCSWASERNLCRKKEKSQEEGKQRTGTQNEKQEKKNTKKEWSKECRHNLKILALSPCYCLLISIRECWLSGKTLIHVFWMMLSIFNTTRYCVF